MNSIKANAYTNRHDNQQHLLYFHWTNNIMNNIPSADKKNYQQLKHCSYPYIYWIDSNEN